MRNDAEPERVCFSGDADCCCVDATLRVRTLLLLSECEAVKVCERDVAPVRVARFDVVTEKESASLVVAV